MFDSCCELIQMSDKYFAWLEINVADAVSDKNKQTNTKNKQTNIPLSIFNMELNIQMKAKRQ